MIKICQKESDPNSKRQATATNESVLTRTNEKMDLHRKEKNSLPPLAPANRSHK